MPIDIPPIGVDRPLPDDPGYLDFRFKPFAEMTDEDYQRLGFRSGLEIHQQILTEKKLFCHCPAGRYSHTYHAEILRHMRPTLSELGEYDGTALMEFKTGKDIFYHINRETVCTYEMDDTPPFHLNRDALAIALEMGLLYKCSMVDEIHIARKQYLDGSIPTGFQRTTIVGVDGWIPYKDRRIDLIQLGLEEDSCREVSDIGHRRTYNSDRLGMPLIETVTAPQMTTPKEVAEVGEILRRLTRSTGKMRTGMGAGRQDVNVSIHGGTRIEIKGVSKISLIPQLTYNEAMRQFNLLKLREELKRRSITEETFRARMDDVTHIVRKSRYAPLREAMSKGHEVYCVTLFGFHGLLHWSTQNDTYFGQEISDRVRVIACLTNLPNIVHSDSHSDMLATSEWIALRKLAGASEEDTMVLVWGDHRDASLGAKEIIARAKEATIGVPPETRQAFDDGTNGFERILPGPNRMYPDTDLPPKQVTREWLDSISAGLPDYYWDREAWYREIGVPEDLIRDLAISTLAPLFARAVKEWKVDPKIAAIMLIQVPIALRRKGEPISSLELTDWESMLQAVAKGLVAREGIVRLIQKVISAGGYSESCLPESADANLIDSVIAESCLFASKINPTELDIRLRAAMGCAMERLLGRYPGKELARRIEAELKKISSN